MTEDEELLNELRKITRILLIANRSAIEAELSKVVTTDERKKMWLLIDGNRMPKEIASLVGVTQMAVSNFLSIAITAGLVQYNRRNPPSRILDYIPPTWLEKVKGISELAENAKSGGEVQ